MSEIALMPVALSWQDVHLNLTFQTSRFAFYSRDGKHSRFSIHKRNWGFVVNMSVDKGKNEWSIVKSLDCGSMQAAEAKANEWLNEWLEGI